MLLGILLAAHILVCVILITLVLLQRSEGGALGMGGGPSGFMTARGAGDLLTRLTWIFGTIFFVLSLVLTLLAGRERATDALDRIKIEAIDPAKLNQPAAPAPSAPAPAQAVPGQAPLTAPTPQVRNPFAGTEPAEQPAAPQNP